MRITRYSNPEEFLAAAGEILYRDEALHSLMIGVVERVQRNPQAYGEIPPYLAVAFDGETPQLAGTMTPPFGLLVTALRPEAEAAMPVLAADLASGEWPLPDVQGVSPLSLTFARAWEDHTGRAYALRMAQRLYVLTQVTMPAGVPGRFLQADDSQTELIAEWMRAFEREALGEEPRTLERAIEGVAPRIAAGDWFLWQDGGKIVSMCLKTRPTRTGCAVSGVYTPPELRRKGYAGACVAALSQRLLDDGFSFTSLFTDLSNPTSNSVYLKIGYRPRADFDSYRISPISP
jgi:predicted GNAT family acetyltransferase